MLVMIDGPMINRFIDDVDSFQKCADDRFHQLDIDGDGFLSRNDLRWTLSRSIALEQAPLQAKEDEKEGEDITRDSDLFFSRFDVNRNNSIDEEEFKPMLKEILTAIARGIGSTPVSVSVEEESLLVRVYEHDLERSKREPEEEVSGGKRNRSGWKKTLRTKSGKILKIFACSSW